MAALRIAGRQLIVERPDEDHGEDHGEDSDEDHGDSGAMMWGSYPMAPWAGRVKHATFRFGGRQYVVSANLAPHAIHGTVFNAPWQVDDADATSVTLSCSLGTDWPFGGHAHQRIELRPEQLVCELAVIAGDSAMPVQLGWHPWFVKPRSATLRFEMMYARGAEGVPTGELIEPPVGPWDDCFVRPLAPLTLHHDDLTVTVESDCEHWVVYDRPTHATCVEPQSGPPDGFNLEPHLLAPGQRLTRWMRIRWAEIGRDRP